MRTLDIKLRFTCAFAFAACLAWARPSTLRAEEGAADADAYKQRADAYQRGRADDLFIAGKQRLAANDNVAACSLLAQSYQLDPATGSLLALALCHERQGKLASALREYEDVVARSQKEQRPDRERAALLQIVSLRPRLSTLTLRPEEPASTLIVRVNGEVVPPEQVGRPEPCDGGFVLVEAEADGKTSWRTGVTIAESGEALTVAIPKMRTVPASAPAKAAEPAAGKASAARKIDWRPRTEPRFSMLQRTGIALLSVGAVSAGVAIGFTVRAVDKDKSSDRGCFDDLCTKSARRDRVDARSAGNIATIATVATAAFAAGGLVAYLIGTKRKNDEREGRSLRLRASAWFDPRSAGAVVSGGF